jgi:ornithine carbamoyltransferase
MAISLNGRSFLTLSDYTPEEIRYLLDLSHQVKKEKTEGKRLQRFQGKTLALLFEKRSTRTRCAFETAFGEEGGHPVFLSTQDIQWEQKRAWKTPPGCWEECSMPYSFGDLNRRPWRSLPVFGGSCL